MSKKSNTKDFTEKAIKVHNNAYDYSLVEYTTASAFVDIICSVHGVFSQRANSHLSGKGCNLCRGTRVGNSFRLSTEEVVLRFKEQHGDRYDYSRVNYHNAHTPVEIVCKEHGPFMQSYANHYSGGNGCYECTVGVSPWTRSGFSSIAKGTPATLYLIKCSSDYELFYKIGITTRGVEYRFRDSRLMPYSYTVEHILEDEPELVWDLERYLHKQFKPFKYLPNVGFDGRHECFSCVDSVEYTKIIEDFKRNEVYQKFPPSFGS